MFSECIIVRRSSLQEGIVWVIVLLSRSDDRKYGSVRTFHDSRALRVVLGTQARFGRWTSMSGRPTQT